jgi:glycoside/pentoside/hexuronide:cation symporter, GPH family
MTHSFDPDVSAKQTEYDRPLSVWTKLAFGAGDLGPAITANITIFFQLVFFTNVAGIPAGWAGSILMISKIWDAVNDPFIGVLSDKTRSKRWGRRLPWLLYGAIPFGLFSFLIWIVPNFGGMSPSTKVWMLFWYYVIVGAISQVFYTVVNLPYTAMTPELTQDYDERTQLNSYRFAFSIGGSIFSLILAKIIFQIVPESQGAAQYLWLAALCAIISVLALYWCVFGTRKRAMAFEAKRIQVSSEETIPLVQQFKIALSNRPFLFVIGIYLCSWLAVQVTASIIPYFVVNRMGLKQADVPTVLIGVQGTAMLMLFVWTRLSKTLGKKAVYFMGMGLWIIAQVGLYFLEPGQIGLMYVLAVMAGVGVSTAYLVPWSMIPDVIELDELQTGQRREGVFYGFMVLLQKFGLALGLFLVGLSLQAAGFKEAVAGMPLPPQPASAVDAIRFAIGPFPTISLILGLVLTYFYPITKEVHAEVMLKLAERKRNQTAL